MYEDKKQKNQSENYSVTCGEQVTLFAAGCTEKRIVPNISGRFFLKENHIYGIIVAERSGYQCSTSYTAAQARENHTK